MPDYERHHQKSTKRRGSESTPMSMNVSEIMQALLPLVEVLEQLGVAYHLGGSVASSLYGEARPTQDVDIVADMQLQHVRTFVKQLETSYYVDEDTVRDAIQRRSSFSVIFTDSMMKIDIFLPKARAFDRQELAGVRRQPLQRGGRLFPVASPEDMILNKLEWYRMGGGVSRRQWNDILGILKAQGTSLDLAYLERWAGVLQVADLLHRALTETGLGQA